MKEKNLIHTTVPLEFKAFPILPCHHHDRDASNYGWAPSSKQNFQNRFRLRLPEWKGQMDISGDISQMSVVT